MIEVKRNWLFYLGSAVFMITLSALASGCRFGNKVEGGGQLQNPLDPVTGWYESEPQHLEMCASVYPSKPGVPEKTCKDIATNQIPSLINAHLTNPVGIDWEKTEMGNAILVASDMRTWMPIWIEDNKRIDTHPSLGSVPQIMLDDDSCYTTGAVHVEGSIDQTGGTTLTREIKARGRVYLSVDVKDSFSEGCETLWTKVGDCYLDMNQCGGTSVADNEQRQIDLYRIFYHYIEAGALTPEQIPMVESLSYSVSYK